MDVVAGIHHVNIQVADLDAAASFYSGVLGLEKIDRPDFPTPGLWYAIGSQQLHIGVLDAHQGPERQHFAIHVTDLDAVVRVIESRGVAVKRATTAYAGAGRQATLRDPSGNLIELNQPD